MLNPEKNWHEILQICPPHLSHVATLPWEIQKCHFSTLLPIYFRLFTLLQKKTNSNCCTAALAVYLLLFNASYYLHSPSTASGACYRRSACIDIDMLRLAAAACCDVGWISASVVYCAPDQCRKRLEACIHAEGGQSEHLLWHCLPDIPVATRHNRFFSEPPIATHKWLSSEPPAFEKCNKPSVRWKTFAFHRLVAFWGGMSKWITVCFLVRWRKWLGLRKWCMYE